ncbi:hypothetical protein P7C70_g3470, partial [Phenoliferia sp. Uapishka_3]
MCRLPAAVLCRAPGLVAISFDHSGRTTSAYAGLRDATSTDPISLDTTLWMASMSKSAVSLAALVLVERESFDMDSNAKLAEVLPELKLGNGESLDKIFDGKDEKGEWKTRSAKVGITLRHLLLHTSGLGYFFTSEEDAMQHEPLGPLPPVTTGAESAFNVVRSFEAGEKFLYGCSTDWVARFIERKTGLTLRAALKTLIFDPLGVPSDQLDLYRSEGMNENCSAIHAKVAPGTFIPIPFDTPQFDVPPPGFVPLASAGLWGYVPLYFFLDSTTHDLNHLSGSTLPAWVEFLQCLLHESAPSSGGPPLISKKLWDEATQDGLGPMGVKLPPLVLTTADPQLCSNLGVYSEAMDETVEEKEGWTMLSTVVNKTKSRSGKSVGAHGWAGLSNSYYFVDPEAGVGGVIVAQFLPFADEEMLKLRDEFESLIYRQLECAVEV